MNVQATPNQFDTVNDPNVVQLRKIGNSAGLIISKDLMNRLNFQLGEAFMIVTQPDGSLVLRRHDDLHARALAIARQVMVEYAEDRKSVV